MSSTPPLPHLHCPFYSITCEGARLSAGFLPESDMPQRLTPQFTDLGMRAIVYTASQDVVGSRASSAMHGYDIPAASWPSGWRRSCGASAYLPGDSFRMSGRLYSGSSSRTQLKTNVEVSAVHVALPSVFAVLGIMSNPFCAQNAFAALVASMMLCPVTAPPRACPFIM